MTTPAVLWRACPPALGVERAGRIASDADRHGGSVTCIAARALQALGVPVAAAGRPSVVTIVTVTAWLSVRYRRLA